MCYYGRIITDEKKGLITVKLKSALCIFLAFITAFCCTVIPVYAEKDITGDNGITIIYGKSYPLQLEGNYTFGTSDKKVACVDTRGTVKSMGRGTCVITAVDKETGEKNFFAVTVKVEWWKIITNLIYWINNFNCEICEKCPVIPYEGEEPITEPVTEPSSVPTEPSSEPSSDPTEPSSDPTEPSSDPLTWSSITPTSSKPAVEGETVSTFGDINDERVNDSVAVGDYSYFCGNSYLKGFVGKTDKDGNQIWFTNELSVTPEVYPLGITVYYNKLYVCGYSMNPRTFVLSGFIAKYDFNGNEQWTKTFTADKNVRFNAIAGTTDGIIVAGSTDSNSGDFTITSGTDYGCNRALLMKIDFNGEILSKKYLAGPAASEFTDVDTDENGNIFASVSTLTTEGNYASFNGLVAGKLGCVIIKYSPTFSQSWYYTLTTGGRDYFNSVAADGAGGCLAGGYYDCKAGITEGTVSGKPVGGGLDAYIVKINPQGYKSWEQSLTGDKNDVITDIARVKNGYVVTGYSESASGEVYSSYGDADGFAYVISDKGRKITYLNFGGSECDKATTVAYSNSILSVYGVSTSKDIMFEGKNQNADAANNSFDCFAAKYKTNF